MDQALRNAVLERLDLLDRLAEEDRPETVFPLARTELHRLIEGWRALLERHLPDDNGRCGTCHGTVWGRRWPCGIWFAIHYYLVGDAGDHAETTGRHRPTVDPPLHSLLRHSRFGRAGREDSPDTASSSSVDTPVLPEPVVAAGAHDPARWQVGIVRTLSEPHPSESSSRGKRSAERAARHSSEPATDEIPMTPPVGGHLETDHTRIHRAGLPQRLPSEPEGQIAAGSRCR